MIDILRTLNTEQKIGQLFVIGISGPEIDQHTEALIDEISPGGICLFARNIRSLHQTRQLTDALRDRSSVLPLLAIDQEGGLVDRLRRVLSPMPAADQIYTASEARWLADVISEALLALGLNMNFAPVVDVVDAGRKGTLNGLSSRTFGSSKEEVTDLAGEFLSVLQSGGILGCLKHFPGLGASAVDSHEELPVVKSTEEELHSIDLYPYQKLIETGDVNAVMVGHAAFPNALEQEPDQKGRLLPSSMNFDLVTNLLRGELGFDGLVITDDLEMGAIMRNYGIGEACISAVLAGVDMLAICSDPIAIRNAHQALLEAVSDGRIQMGRIDQSLQRIAKLKARITTPAPFDLQNLSRISGEIAGFSSRVVAS
jgi:beta-N-acetylhexosaminidase